MGQYYKALILNRSKTRPVLYACSHDFGAGLKLMEHSWQGNNFVGHVEKLLIDNPQPIVWAGDYADNEPVKNIDKDTYKAILNELKGYDKDNAKQDTKTNYAETFEKEGTNLYSIADHTAIRITHDEKIEGNTWEHSFKTISKRFKYLVNHDKKQFIDKSKVPLDGDGWQIHPLPLMTCEGNGRGGGDFRGESKLVGSWARDVISVTSKKSDIPKDFQEVLFNLTE